jgi:hypothetical protein
MGEPARKADPAPRTSGGALNGAAALKWVNRLGGAAVKQAMEPDQARDFANRMRAHLIAYDRQQGGASTAVPKAKKPAVNGRGPSGDGLPF